MSGPYAEIARLHIRTSVDVALWPLRLWSDRGEAHIECGECDSGDLLVAQVKGRDFVIADLTTILEQHLQQCPAANRS